MFGCLVPLGRLWSFTQNHQRGEGLPSAPVTGLTFNDYDVRPGFMRGEASARGAEDLAQRRQC